MMHLSFRTLSLSMGEKTFPIFYFTPAFAGRQAYGVLSVRWGFNVLQILNPYGIWKTTLLGVKYRHATP